MNIPIVYHCEKSCDVKFIELEYGEHDWAWIDEEGMEHCAICYDEGCSGREPIDEDIP